MRAMATVEMYISRDNDGRGCDDSDDAECGDDSDSDGNECGDVDSAGDGCSVDDSGDEGHGGDDSDGDDNKLLRTALFWESRMAITITLHDNEDFCQNKALRL